MIHTSLPTAFISYSRRSVPVVQNGGYRIGGRLRAGTHHDQKQGIRSLFIAHRRHEICAHRTARRSHTGDQSNRGQCKGSHNKSQRVEWFHPKEEGQSGYHTRKGNAQAIAQNLTQEVGTGCAEHS